MTDFPKHHAIEISHDVHRVYYEPIREHLTNAHGLIVTEDECAECEAADSCWEVHLYPTGATNFYHVAGATLEKAMERLRAQMGKKP